MLHRKEKKKEKNEEPIITASGHERGIRLPTLRLLRLGLQVIFFILLNAGLFQLASLAFPIPAIPVLSSSAAPGVTAISAFDALQYGISAALPVLLGVAVSAFLISAVLVGRAFCAFVCPFGFAQDLLGFLRRPLQIRAFTTSPKTTKTITRIKYYVLGAVLLLAIVVGVGALSGSREYVADALGVFSDVPFAVISPADTLFATLPELIILGKPLIAGWSFLLWTRVVILIASLAFAVYIPRAFCRYICPVAALMGPLNRYTVLGLERNPVKCTGEKCKICEKVCPMDVPIFTGPEKRFTRHPECIMCLVCKDVCEHKAIRFGVL